MSRDSSEERVKIPKCPFEVYRSEGDAFFTKQKFKKAIEAYSQALEIKEQDVHCLLQRSTCQNLLGNTEEALNDANVVLSVCPNYYRGLFQKAEVLYNKGEFESSLVCYHQGFQQRPELREFRIGIQKCEEAIENSLRIQKLRATKQTKRDSVTTISDDARSDQRSVTGSKPKDDRDKVKEDYPMHLLPTARSRRTFGYLHDDHAYLKKLLKQEGKPKSKTESSDQISRLVREELDYLDNRSKFWLEEKPLFARRHPKINKERQLALEKKKRGKAIIRVLERLHEIDRYQHAEEHVLAVKLAEDLRQEVGEWTEDVFPDRMEVLANVYSLLGLSQLELGRYDEALQAHTEAHNLGQKCNLPEVVSHALDNIGRAYAKKGDYEAAIEVWEKKLSECEDKHELIWLRYEIGRCNLELNRTEQALEQGDQALILANELDDQSWQLNLNVLIGQANLQLKRRIEAQHAFGKARELASMLKAEKAEKAILEVIDQFQGTEEEVDSETLNFTEIESDGVSSKGKSKREVTIRFPRYKH